MSTSNPPAFTPNVAPRRTVSEPSERSRSPPIMASPSASRSPPTASPLLSTSRWPVSSTSPTMRCAFEPAGARNWIVPYTSSRFASSTHSRKRPGWLPYMVTVKPAPFSPTARSPPTCSPPPTVRSRSNATERAKVAEPPTSIAPTTVMSPSHASEPAIEKSPVNETSPSMTTWSSTCSARRDGSCTSSPSRRTYSDGRRTATRAWRSSGVSSRSSPSAVVSIRRRRPPPTMARLPLMVRSFMMVCPSTSKSPSTLMLPTCSKLPREKIERVLSRSASAS
mmetsp:Transcript_23298/g.59880  ORF Transcript_23298/g.59880 Transcript_23298/m.59880 type:complete len:280 (+) Transcript_23298:724-1563(+)